MKKYPKYKPSKIEWIGEIPEHWEIRKFKYIALKILDGDWVESKDQVENGDYKLIQLKNIGNMKIIKAVDKEINQYFFIEKKCTKIEKNNLLIARIPEPILRTAIFNYENSNYITVVDISIVTIPDENCAKFYAYFLNSEPIKLYGESLLSGATRQRISKEDIKNLTFISPPLPEQQAIASFLDDKTAKIDTLIDKKQKMIDLLKDERTAVINQAVTKGINPSVKMKPSGIEWLGEIPDHWDVRKLKWVASYFKGFAFKSEYFTSDGIPIVKVSNMKNNKIINISSYIAENNQKKEFENCRLEYGDILISTVGSKPEIVDSAVGQIAIVDKLFVNSYLNQNALCIRVKDKMILKEFLRFIFLSKHFRVNLDSISSWIANQAYIEVEDILNIEVLIPNLQEQQEIVTYIETQTNRIDTAITKIEKEIELLQEYRQALISEAVTGKIDVRGDIK